MSVKNKTQEGYHKCAKYMEEVNRKPAPQADGEAYFVTKACQFRGCDCHQTRFVREE